MRLILSIGITQNNIREWQCLLASGDYKNEGISLGNSLLEITENWLQYISAAIQLRKTSFRSKIEQQRTRVHRLNQAELEQSLHEAEKIGAIILRTYGVLHITRGLSQSIKEMRDFSASSRGVYPIVLSDTERQKAQIALYVLGGEDE